jgi:dipeptidyl aminopeptidase/acylaminoacyl peptidase
MVALLPRRQAATLASLACMAWAFGCHAGSSEPISIADMVRQTKFGDPANVGWRDYSGWQPAAAVSPDLSKAAVIVRNGEVTAEVNVGRLYVVKSGGSGKPVLEPIASLSCATNDQPIALLKWLGDSASLMFAGCNGREPSQVYRVNLSDRKVTRITQEADLQWYDVDRTGKHLLTQSVAPNRPPGTVSECIERGCRVSVNTLYEAETGASGGSLPLSYYNLDSGKRIVTELPERRYREIEKCPRSPLGGLSADGKFALWICWLRANDIPPWWDELDIAKKALYGLVGGVGWYEAQDMNGAGRLMLVNLETGLTEPLIDAPFAESIGKVTWILNGTRVVLAGTFESLVGVDGEERSRRAKHLSILSIDPRTRQSEIIARLDDSARAIRELSWDEKRGVLTVIRLQADQSLMTAKYVREKGRWIEQRLAHADVAPSSLSVTLRDGTKLLVEQSANERPKLFAINPRGGIRVLLSDPDAWLEDRSVGKVESVTWSLKDGRRWQGGLIYPSGYSKGKRLPLLLQTHGFYPERFDLDGGTSRNYPGQALAAKGIFVLQVDDQALGAPDHDNGLAEWTSIQDAYESAIDFLDKEGLIDRSRVGIIGWSRSGMYTAYTLTHSTCPFAAAAYTSTGGFGYWYYISMNRQAQHEFDADYGAAPFGKGTDVWSRMSPGFNFDRARTPTFMWENLNLSGIWDWYSAMQRFNVPVEYWYLPTGAHDIYSVPQRIRTLDLLVDWFVFWLKGEEDSDPAKKEQYIRWRDMRTHFLPGRESDQGGTDVAAPPTLPPRG